MPRVSALAGVANGSRVAGFQPLPGMTATRDETSGAIFSGHWLRCGSCALWKRTASPCLRRHPAVPGLTECLSVASHSCGSTRARGGQFPLRRHPGPEPGSIPRRRPVHACERRMRLHRVSASAERGRTPSLHLRFSQMIRRIYLDENQI